MQSFFGRLSEISSGPGTAALTLTLRLVAEAQRLGEPVAWITDRASRFFPPDARAAGVDLDALVVCSLPFRSHGAPRRSLRGGAFPPRSDPREDGGAALQAADLLVRSGGFGLVVLDLDGDDFRGGLRRDLDLPMAMQSRLAGLARRHRTAILCLTEKSRDERSLGSLVSLRVEATRTEKIGDRFGYEVRILKDKYCAFPPRSPQGDGGGAFPHRSPQRDDSSDGYSGGGPRPGDLVLKETCRAPDGLC